MNRRKHVSKSNSLRNELLDIVTKLERTRRILKTAIEGFILLGLQHECSAQWNFQKSLPASTVQCEAFVTSFCLKYSLSPGVP